MPFPSKTKEEIFGSAYASAVYIAEVLKLPKDERVYVIGEAGIEEELDSEGIQHIGGTVNTLNTTERPHAAQSSNALHRIRKTVASPPHSRSPRSRSIQR